MEYSLVQHQQGSNQTRNGRAFEDDGNQENGGGGGEVEQNQGQHELPEHRNLRHETNQAVHDATKQERWNNSKGKDVEEDLR